MTEYIELREQGFDEDEAYELVAQSKASVPDDEYDDYDLFQFVENEEWNTEQD